MATRDQRGSDKILAAWHARALSEESVAEISEALEESPATVESVEFVGGSKATGVRISLSYDGEDGPWCGNDLSRWIKWHQVFGGNPRPPVIIINGRPNPELITMQLEFGETGQ